MRLAYIAGGAASGKSAISARVASLLGSDRCSIICMDDYFFHPSEMTVYYSGLANWDSPASVDSAQLNADIAKLTSGLAVITPYDSDTFAYSDKNPTRGGKTVFPREFLIVEGLFVAWPFFMQKKPHISIFVDCPIETAMNRRIRPIMTEAYISGVHLPMYTKYILPQRSCVDLVVDSERNSITDNAEAIVAQLETCG
jgi:uridine kinase